MLKIEIAREIASNFSILPNLASNKFASTYKGTRPYFFVKNYKDVYGEYIRSDYASVNMTLNLKDNVSHKIDAEF